MTIQTNSVLLDSPIRKTYALLSLVLVMVLSACGSSGTVEITTPTEPSPSRPTQPGPRPTDAEQAVVIRWERSGGIAGACQRLTVYSGGAYLLQDCVKEATVGEGALPKDKWERLTGWLSQYHTFDWQFRPPPGSADMFSDHYTFRGQGNLSPSESQQTEINDYLALLARELSGPSPTSSESASGESGIEVEVFIGPTCPVVRVGDSRCQDQPYQATLTVINAQTGQVVTSFQTDAEGRFRLTLAPGTYLLQPASPGRYPAAKEQRITVTRGQFVYVRITYDSGIR